MLRILGIDPGSVCTGYGVIETDGRASRYLAHGEIRTQREPLTDRLGRIFTGLNEVLLQWRPAEVAIEQVFVSNNAKSALTLGQARGAAICAAVHSGYPVAEYSARSVKQAVVGTGAADKAQVAYMVGVLLNHRVALSADAADALAVAICHGAMRVAPLAQLNVVTR